MATISKIMILLSLFHMTKVRMGGRQPLFCMRTLGDPPQSCCLDLHTILLRLSKNASFSFIFLNIVLW